MERELAVESPVSSDGKRVLLLPPTSADGLAMGKLFGSHQVEFVICKNMRQLCDWYRAGAGTLIVSEEAILADPGELAACLVGQEMWSDLPIIVLSRAGRESSALAESVARLGNVSVIERPVRMTTLISLVRSSLRARERQYEVRRYLIEQEQAQRKIQESVDAERAARGDAERANRIKDEFLATLSHELRTPLNAVLGWTQVMRRSRDLASDAPNALDVIERNARAQAQIIQDLLDMSGIISGKIRLAVQPLDLASLINATVETIRPAALTKSIRLQVNLDPAGGSVRGDPNRLQQVLWNLLTNAVKFTGKGGHISIAMVRKGAHAEVEVTDDGEGMDAGFLPLVFDRFRQADSSITRTHGGLGLGLSIVKQLVELHGGSVSAKSAGRGLGSTFRMTLPLMAAGDDPADPDSASQFPVAPAKSVRRNEVYATDLAGMKILVVDDEPDARSLIERLLKDCNASVTTAASASDGMTALARDAPDILISDIGMPGEDGYAFIRRVRSSTDRSVGIPAIALTAYARTDDRVRAINAGYQSHLSKPVDPAELIAMVKRLAGLQPAGRRTDA